MAEETCNEGRLLLNESASLPLFNKIVVKFLHIIHCFKAQNVTNEVSETHEDSRNGGEESKLKSHKESDYASPTQLQKDLAEESRRSAEDAEYFKMRTLLCFEEAPEYLQHNPYIRGGYRKFLPTKLCWESIFWWTNETVNIWTHLFGWFLFLGLTINDLILINIHATLTDKFIAGILLGCFQVCMVSSSLYHTFSCRSENDFNCFLMYDLFGIALSLLAIYTSGIYYAFWCLPELKSFYLVTVTLIFVFAMGVQLPRLQVPYAWKTLIFIGWAAYGIVPTMHWVIEMGGFDNPLVAMLFPRVIGMYAISGIAFLIYFCKIPERWFAGKVDYLGHSHQWWHLFVVLALWYWHNTGMLYVQYRMNHGCAKTMRIF